VCCLEKTLRRVWNLPLNTHSYFLFELSHTLPVYDAVCKRVLSFISKWFNSDCDLVSFSARQAVLYGCTMLSPLGRSALCCSLRYMFDIECLLCPQFNHCNVVRNFYLSWGIYRSSVGVLKYMLFRDYPNQCIGLFDTDEIAIASKCISIE